MNQLKHTPGPWIIKKSAVSYFIDARLKGSTMQEVAYIGATETNEQHEANARLIAAAPDMYDALRQWLYAEKYEDQEEMENAISLRDKIITRFEVGQ